MFGSSYMISLILKFIVEKGIDYLNAFSEAHKAEVEAYVKGHVPAVLAGPAWAVVSALWEEILVAAKLYADMLLAGNSQASSLSAAMAHVAPAAVKVHQDLSMKAAA